MRAVMQVPPTRPLVGVEMHMQWKRLLYSSELDPCEGLESEPGRREDDDILLQFETHSIRNP